MTIADFDKLWRLVGFIASKDVKSLPLSNLVKSKIPPYFKDQSVSILSYVYTRPIASKMFNYKHVLRDLNIDKFKSKPPDCTCARSSFKYNPTGHAITGDLKIINITSLRELFAKGLNIVSLNR